MIINFSQIRNIFSFSGASAVGSVTRTITLLMQRLHLHLNPGEGDGGGSIPGFNVQRVEAGKSSGAIFPDFPDLDLVETPDTLALTILFICFYFGWTCLMF